MTDRQRMLAVLKGEEIDRIPFCPRMDLWAIANQARRALPDRFTDMNTVEIARELEVGCHAVEADYTLPRSQEDHMIRVFGFENHPDYKNSTPQLVLEPPRLSRIPSVGL